MASRDTPGQQWCNNNDNDTTTMHDDTAMTPNNETDDGNVTMTQDDDHMAMTQDDDELWGYGELIYVFMSKYVLAHP